MKSKSWRPKNFLPVFAGVLFLDQSFKFICVQSGSYLKNRAGLFGLEVDPFLSLLALLLLLGIILPEFRNREEAARFSLPLALLLGGIFSNLFDRAWRGFIVDYIRLSDAFIFNFADVAIALGAIFFIWRIMKE